MAKRSMKMRGYSVGVERQTTAFNPQFKLCARQIADVGRYADRARQNFARTTWR